MSKFLLYSVNGRGSSASIDSGSIPSNGGDYTSNSSKVTNDERLLDDSVATAANFTATDTAVRIDKGSASIDVIDSFAFHSSAAGSNGIEVYTNSASNNSSTAEKLAFDTIIQGWNVSAQSETRADSSGKITASESERYWYVTAHQGAVATITEIMFAKQVNLTNVTLAGTEGVINGNKVVQIQGGVQYSNKRHDGIRFFNFDLKFISNTYKTTLETMRDSVFGSHDKLLYYDGSEYILVRLSDDSLQFKEVAFNVFDTQIKLTEQLS